MNVIEATTPRDLSIMAFQEAVGQLGVFPDEVLLYCSQSCACIAYKIREEYGCGVLLVPSVLMKNVFVWGVLCNDSMYWLDVTA